MEELERKTEEKIIERIKKKNKRKLSTTEKKQTEKLQKAAETGRISECRLSIMEDTFSVLQDHKTSWSKWQIHYKSYIQVHEARKCVPCCYLEKTHCESSTLQRGTACRRNSVEEHDLRMDLVISEKGCYKIEIRSATIWKSSHHKIVFAMLFYKKFCIQMFTRKSDDYKKW